MKLSNKESFIQKTYRNLVVEFLSYNSTRQQQYQVAVEKAKETLEVIEDELGK